MKTKSDLIQINQRQKEFYDSAASAEFGDDGSRHEKRNLVTAMWQSVSRALIELDDECGMRDATANDHKSWIGDLSEKSVLDLGCFSGNALSMWLAKNSDQYLGIDLSEKGLSVLQGYFDKVELKNASLSAVDFLAAEYPAGSFDVVYAHAVLHHFENFELLCEEIHRVLKPGGKLVSVDPLQTEPLNYLARALYRPFQSDKDWEWPFGRSNFRMLERYFEFKNIRGFRGMSKLATPFAVLPFTMPIARWIYRKGVKFDDKFASRLGLPLYLCWNVSMHMQRRSD